MPDVVLNSNEIKHAANDTSKGNVFIQTITSWNINHVIGIIEDLSTPDNKKRIIDSCDQLGIDLEALKMLDRANPSIPYSFYFCTPDWLIDHPELFLYYRNLAALSREVMSSIGYNTQPYEENTAIPDRETAITIARYLNEIISGIIRISGVTQNRRLEMFFMNLGDSLAVRSTPLAT